LKIGQRGNWLRDLYDIFAVQRELDWLHKRINEVFTVGGVDFDRTITPAGTTAPQTINKNAGSVNLAAGESSKVVTNSLVTVNSLIFCTILTNDATAILKNVVPADGSFTIRTTAAVTAETKIGFLVTN
jgi:hypothetical protein